MDEQARKILGHIWADNAPENRQTPEDAGINRAQGWDSNYEQAGTFRFPERRVWNQFGCEVTAGINEHYRNGCFRWDVDVDWEQYDFVMHNGSLYVALAANGPTTSNAEEPGTGTSWRLY